MGSAMKRSARLLLAMTPLLLTSLSEAKDLPNFNAYYGAPRVAPARLPSASPPAFVASTDAQRGVPTFVWAARSGRPSGLATVVTSPEAAARRHLAAHAARYGLSSAALGTAVVTQVHDLGHGGIVVILRQRIDGVELFHNDVKVLMDRGHELVAIAGNLHAAAVPAPKVAASSLSEARAIAAAVQDLHDVSLAPADLVDLKKVKADYHYYDLAPGSKAAAGLRFVVPARVKPVFFAMPDRLVPAYFVELLSGPSTGATGAHAHVIAADDGRLLYRENLTHSDTFSYRVWADPTGDHRPQDGPLADYSPYPASMPDGSFPGYTLPNLISIDGFNKTHDPWLATGATQTSGNNVDAYTDDDKPDGFSANDIRATTTGPNAFDRVFDTGLGPQSSPDQKMAAITSLFYTTNWLHDWWYDSGFDEAGGNAQANNYGRGGIAGDPLHAEAQDGAPGKRDNSDMSVLSDGGSPRMQMYVWSGISSTVLHVTPSNQDLVNGVADFGPQSFNVSGTVMLVDDGAAPNTDACQPIVNNVMGKIALLDRGTCTFKAKALAAQNAGAIGVILADNVGNEPPPPMGNGSPPGMITIPILSITLADGNALKAALQSGGVTVTMSRSAAVDRDGTIDNTVVAHEWGHYLHLRNVACGSPMCGAQSEGWSDFIALHVVVRQGDDLGAAFPLAQHATAAFPDDPAYFGIRRYPYSIDFSKNPLTFKHIADSEPLPTTAPVAQSNAQVNNAEVHAAGEVWSAMLFEGFVAMLQNSQGPNPPYSFDEARRRISDYVVAGMKLAPVDPTYTEQRDGVLAAAAAADADDLLILAKAFARRGAGTCAVSPARDSNDFEGVVESFTVEPNLAVVGVEVDDSVVSCDNDGHLDAEETGKLTITVMNTGTAPLVGAGATVSSTTAGVTFPAGKQVTFGTVAPFATGKATLDIQLAPTLTKMEPMALSVTVTDASSCATTATLTTSPLVNYDAVPKSTTVDTVEDADTVWTLDGDGAAEIWARTESKPGNRVWAGIDFPSPSDTALVSPPLTVGMGAKFVLSFEHRHQFEADDMGVNYDGSVIELTTDGGKTWQDISKFGDPGYGGTIGDPTGGAMNTLKDRDGYVDHNAAWPATDKVSIDMGTALAGKTVQVRFRIGTDDAAGNTGWELDNIGFQGITGKPFTALVDDTSTCGTIPPPDGGPIVVGAGGGGSGSTGGGADFSAAGGCGCFAAGSSSGVPFAAAPLLALGALFLRRRRG
jgi:MYXO-CTERM domain-containing protein